MSISSVVTNSTSSNSIIIISSNSSSNTSSTMATSPLHVEAFCVVCSSRNLLKNACYEALNVPRRLCSLQAHAPAGRWGQGPALMASQEVPMTTRNSQRAPLGMARLQVAGPPPPLQVSMACWWPVEGPPDPRDLRAHFVGEVPVGAVEGPHGQQVPHELVGPRSTNNPRVCKEHEVHHGFPVQLEGHEDEVPQVQGTAIRPPLDEVPIIGQALQDELEVVPLEPEEQRVIEVLQPTKRREGLCRWPVLACSTTNTRFRSR